MTMREGAPGGGKGPLLAKEESLTLATGNGQTLFQPQAFRKSARAQSVADAETWVDDGLANTVNTFDVGDAPTTHAIVEPVNSLTPWPGMGEAMRVYGEDGAGPSLKQHSPNVLQTYGVRRLTPVECERLQAFPDGWTEPAGSDSARYKALGNAVTVNTVGWILRRIKEVG
jgi:site-specific DNA-cytosine methylase